MNADARVLLLIAEDLGSGAQFDQIVLAAGAQEDPVQVAAVHDGVGIAEALPERLIERDPDDLFSGHGVHQPEIVDVDRHAARGVADTKLVERVEGVGAELDTGADLPELKRALEYKAPDAFLSESKRRCKAADAAAGD